MPVVKTTSIETTDNAALEHRRWTADAVIVGGLCFAASLLNYLWLIYDTTPPHWDYAGHLLSAYHYRQAFQSFFSGDAGVVALVKRIVAIDQAVYPPFFPLFASVVTPILSRRA